MVIFVHSVGDKNLRGLETSGQKNVAKLQNQEPLFLGLEKCYAMIILGTVLINQPTVHSGEVSRGKVCGSG